MQAALQTRVHSTGTAKRPDALPLTARAEGVVRGRVADFERDLRQFAQRVAKDCYAESVSARHVEIGYKEKRASTRNRYLLLNSLGGILLSVGVGKAVAICTVAGALTTVGFLVSCVFGAS